MTTNAPTSRLRTPRAPVPSPCPNKRISYKPLAQPDLKEPTISPHPNTKKQPHSPHPTESPASHQAEPSYLSPLAPLLWAGSLAGHGCLLPSNENVASAQSPTKKNKVRTGVSIRPGNTVFTRIKCGASWRAWEEVNETMADLVRRYVMFGSR
jgi:hypothetical protein